MDRFIFKYLFDGKLHDVVAIDFNNGCVFILIDSRKPIKTTLKLENLKQSTGIRAKDGTLIFEGDILTDPDLEKIIEKNPNSPKAPKYIAKYHNHLHKFMIHITGMDDYVDLSEATKSDGVTTPYNIVGNIYTNNVIQFRPKGSQSSS